MYGLIHKSARDMVINELGTHEWDQVVARANLDDEDFLALKSYDDTVLLNLLDAVVHISGIPLPGLLHKFGFHFITRTAYVHYAAVMDTHGRSLWELLANLNHMHDRMTSSFPAYRPPTFTLLPLDTGDYELIYISDRQGLTPFVEGLLDGLAFQFQTMVSVSIIEDTTNGSGQTTRFLLKPATHNE